MSDTPARFQRSVSRKRVVVVASVAMLLALALAAALWFWLGAPRVAAALDHADRSAVAPVGSETLPAVSTTSVPEISGDDVTTECYRYSLPASEDWRLADGSAACRTFAVPAGGDMLTTFTVRAGPSAASLADVAHAEIESSTSAGAELLSSDRLRIGGREVYRNEYATSEGLSIVTYLVAIEPRVAHQGIPVSYVNVGSYSSAWHDRVAESIVATLERGSR